jgi:hypothetical protein
MNCSLKSIPGRPFKQLPHHATFCFSRSSQGLEQCASPILDLIFEERREPFRPKNFNLTCAFS